MLVKGAAMGKDSRGYDHPVCSPSQHHPVPPSDNTLLGSVITIFSWLLSSLTVGFFSVLSILTLLCLFSKCWRNLELGPAPHSLLSALWLDDLIWFHNLNTTYPNLTLTLSVSRISYLHIQLPTSTISIWCLKDISVIFPALKPSSERAPLFYRPCTFSS